MHPSVLCIHPRVAEILSSFDMLQGNEGISKSYKRVDDIVPIPLPVSGGNSEAQARIRWYAMNAQEQNAR